jgi:pimeloyl-ACP methyl ester carboxylesterase
MGVADAVRLKDGRLLAYQVYGGEAGFPVLWFHGTPGGRLEFANQFGQPSIDGTGARVIAIDRPGFGRSDFHKGRSFDSWPSDVIELTAELGIDRFSIVGYSAGGPYVLSCARAIPERLAFAGIVSGVGPAQTPRFREGMGSTDKIMTRLSRLAPPLARLAIKQAVRTAQNNPEKFSKQFDKELSAPDLAVHSDPAFRAAVREVFIEATRQGPAGVVEEYRIWATPWDCPFEQVQVPVRLWHGDDDEIVPLNHARYLANRLPHAELTVIPGAGHLNTPARLHAVFSAAVAGQAQSH